MDPTEEIVEKINKFPHALFKSIYDNIMLSFLIVTFVTNFHATYITDCIFIVSLFEKSIDNSLYPHLVESKNKK